MLWLLLSSCLPKVTMILIMAIQAPVFTKGDFTWWRHQMERFSAQLAICAGNSPVPGEFPTQRPVTRSFDVYFDLRPNKRLSKQSWGWWFETLSCPLWRHRNELDAHSLSWEWQIYSNIYSYHSAKRVNFKNTSLWSAVPVPREKTVSKEKNSHKIMITPLCWIAIGGFNL